jgi:uncharacterized protein (TIGR03435 family)
MMWRYITALLTVLTLLPSITRFAYADDDRFAVVSIRPSDPHGVVTPRRMGLTTFDTTDTLRTLISLAYGLEPYQVIGGPTWITTKLYHVVGKTETPVSSDQMRPMIALMLAERFQLRSHSGSQLMSVYTLTAGPKASTLANAKPDTPKDGPGAIVKNEKGMVTHGSSMRLFVRSLSVQLQRPVIDKTGLEGFYDIRLTFDETAPNEPQGEYGSIFAALGGVGLKLQSQRLPVQVLVVDAVDYPSEN